MAPVATVSWRTTAVPYPVTLSPPRVLSKTWTTAGNPLVAAENVLVTVTPSAVTLFAAPDPSVATRVTAV